MISLEKVMPRHPGPGVPDQVQIVLHRIVAVHPGQQPVRAALHRQVQVPAQMGLGGNGVDQLAAGILGWLVIKRMW